MAAQESYEFNKALPRGIPEGTIPLIDIDGTAYECGRSYAEIVIQEYPRESLSVEFNVGGVGIVPARDGIATCTQTRVSHSNECL
jgi:hypothetical protein